ncbi:MAG TPA: SDR family oxidoreductase [Alphaproteobacteria bacterium]|jgi:WW domain-containing oxidoreductase|nr:SDR family oxidoreductase [Alphaproteobacteria bacterium]
MSLIAAFKPKGPTGFGYASSASDVTEAVSLAGKTVLVTGCNSGLGLETMRVLAARGAHVIGAARTEAKASEAAATVTGKATGVACELSDPASVRACVETVKQMAPLDAIVANAGIMALPKLNQSHGYELQFFTNHIGHFILVTGLLDRLTDDARVVMLSSAAHQMAPAGGIQFDNLSGERGYKGWVAYGQSKIANLLFAKELSRRFGGTKKTANAIHPGVIATNLGRHLGMSSFVSSLVWGTANALFLKTIPQGAATQCYVAANPKAATISGEYWADCNVAKSRAEANDPALAAKLWEVSEKIVAGLA